MNAKASISNVDAYLGWQNHTNNGFVDFCSLQLLSIYFNIPSIYFNPFNISKLGEIIDRPIYSFMHFAFGKASRIFYLELIMTWPQVGEALKIIALAAMSIFAIDIATKTVYPTKPLPLRAVYAATWHNAGCASLTGAV